MLDPSLNLNANIYSGITGGIVERKEMKSFTLKKLGCVIAAGVLAASMLTMTACSQSGNTSSSQSSSTQESSSSLKKAADGIGTHHATIKIKGYDTPIKVELDGDSAPVTVQNFMDLAKSGFYDGLTFHRIIKDFMMQGGDPNGDGTGGSDETIVGEFTSNGYDNELQNTRGAIAMARSSDPDSASSQFYIVQKDSTDLDGDYAVFGYVTSGMDLVDEICNSASPTDDNGTIKAKEQPVIKSITIDD